MNSCSSSGAGIHVVDSNVVFASSSISENSMDFAKIQVGAGVSLQLSNAHFIDSIISKVPRNILLTCKEHDIRYS